jgi:hypothetical protein
MCIQIHRLGQFLSEPKGVSIPYRHTYFETIV